MNKSTVSRLQATLVLLLSQVALLAQTGGVGNPAGAGGTPASSYAVSGIDSVNYYNGHVNISIPLMTVGGRGLASQTAVATLDQQWDVIDSGGSLVPSAPIQPFLAPSYAAGSLLATTTSGDPYGCPVYENGSWNYRGLGPFNTYLTWRTTNGTSIVLKDVKVNGKPQGADVQDCSRLNTYQAANRGRVFRSTDSSDTIFYADADVIDGQTLRTIAGTLITRDGTKYRFDAYSYLQSITDRNGNRILYSWASTYNGGTYRVTDQLGRVSTIDYVHPGPGATRLNDILTYPGAAGESRQVKVNYQLLQDTLDNGKVLQTYQCLFPGLNGSSSTKYNPYVISSIDLPNGTSYRMLYNSYGEVTRLTLPTGGAYAYQYREASSCSATEDSGIVWLANNSGAFILRRLKERLEYADGQTLSGRTKFTDSWVSNSPIGKPAIESAVWRYDLSDNVLAWEKHMFYGNPLSNEPPPDDAGKAADWRLGLEYLTEYNEPGKTLKKEERAYSQRPCGVGEDCWFDPQAADAPAHDVQVCQVNTTLGAQMVAQVMSYDQHNNLTDRDEFESYHAPAIGVTCASGNGAIRHTHTDYEGRAPYTDPGVHITNLPYSTVVKDIDGVQAARTEFRYDAFPLAPAPGITGHDSVNYGGGGQRGNLTEFSRWLNTSHSWVATFTHFDIAGNVVETSDGKGHTTSIGYNYDGRNLYAFPTVTTNLLGHTTIGWYNTNLGKPDAITDANNVVTFYSYDDPLGRLTQVKRASGGGDSLESRTTYSYMNPTWTITKTDLAQTGDQAIRNDTITDGFGRVVTGLQYEDSWSKYIETAQAYNTLGRAARASNPYRPGESKLETETSYDALGRPVSVRYPDGAVETMSYQSNETTVTDAAGKQKRYIYDGLGRLYAVEENPNGTKYRTDYRYDALDNLVQVRHGSCPDCQYRFFVYDSLSRLTKATNPESGTVQYEYDPASNLTKKTDNRQVVTSYEYDALNRLRRKSYSDGTPPVNYEYDNPAVAYGKGRLTQVSNGWSVNKVTAYDALGRVTASSQTTSGQTYAFTYSYNLAGAVTSIRYPSGRTVSTGYDAANRPILVQSNGTNYVADVRYAAHGGLAQYQYGNNLYRTMSYNSRLQPTGLRDAVENNESKVYWRASLDWGAANNNGNLHSTAVSHGGPGYPQLQSFQQNYSYDAVNRLSGVNDSGGFWRNYGYDARGNRWVTGTGGIGTSGLTPVANIYNNANRINGAYYDGAGNMRSNGTQTLAYDAENRQTTVTESASAGGGQAVYSYDGEGRRVMRTIGSRVTVFVYDVFGNLAAEYNNYATEASPCATCYLSTDHLGSTRLITDANANVIARHDYLPFGEEVRAGDAARRAEWGMTGDVRQKFTGQLRDNETGLDFFNARYLSADQGRFLSPDPENVGASLEDPQSWNACAYVGNNPLNATDPTGMFISIVPKHPKTPPSGSGSGHDYSSDLPFNRCPSCGSSGGPQIPEPPPPPPVVTRVFNWLSQPRNPTCLAASTAVGTSFGAGAGMIGIVGGPAVGITEPTSMAIGGAAGWLGGMITCASSTGGGQGTTGGGGGTQVTSKTLWKSGDGARIDVENPNPGQRAGQIHYQDQTGKYLYDPQTNQFDGAPNRVNQLLSDPRVQSAIQKGLKYLGQ